MGNLSLFREEEGAIAKAKIVTHIISPLKLHTVAAMVFQSGQKFRFPNDNNVYIFIEIRFEYNDPIIGYSNEQEEELEAHGFYLSDLIPA